MTPSRTLEEHPASEEADLGRGSAMDFSTTSEVTSDDVTAAPAARTSKTVDARAFEVKTDSSRDSLLTEFGKETLKDRYLLPGESYQDLFARVASAYADDQAHAQRLLDASSQRWLTHGPPAAWPRG